MGFVDDLAENVTAADPVDEVHPADAGLLRPRGLADPTRPGIVTARAAPAKTEPGNREQNSRLSHRPADCFDQSAYARGAGTANVTNGVGGFASARLLAASESSRETLQSS
jgi:hypothetical protein